MNATIPLRRFLSLQFGMVTVLPVLIIAILIWQLLIPQMRTNIGVHHRELARAIAGQITAHLLGGQRRLAGVARHLDALATHTVNETGILLDAHCGDGTLFETIYTVAMGDNRIQSVGLAQSRRFRRDDILGIDLSGRDFPDVSQATSAATWSPIFLSTVSGRMAVAVIIPSHRGRVIGEITLDQLSAIISRIPVDTGLFTMVLDGAGRVVADSRRILVGQHMDVSTLPASTVTGSAAHSPAAFVMDGLSLVGTIVTMEQLGWKVLVAQSSDIAYRSVRHVFLVMAIGLGLALIVALAFAWRRADRISRLVRLYTRQARAISQGTYDQDWVPSRTREFQHLTENLRAMATTIRHREEQLVASETHLRITLNSIGEAVIATDINGNVSQINPMAETLTGWSGAEALGQPVTDVFRIVDGQNGELLADPVQRVLEHGRLPEPEHPNRLLARDGQRYHIAESGAPIRHPDGGVHGTVIVFRDITQRLAQEEEIRKNERRLRNLFDNVPGVVYQFTSTPVSDMAGVISDFSLDKVQKILGLNSKPHTFFEDFVACIHDEDKPRFLTSTTEAMQNATPWEYEGRFIKPSGEEIWLSGRSAPHRIGSEVVHYGVFMDISRSKRLEASLRLTQFCFDKATIGIFRIGEQAELLDVNEQACRSLGYSRAQLCRMTVFDIDPIFTADMWAGHLVRLRKEGSRTLETVHRRKDGTRFPVQILSNIMSFGGQEFNICYVQDITERKRWENELAASEMRYRALFDDAPVMYLVTDDHAIVPRIKDANKMFLGSLGYRRHEVVGKPLSRYYTVHSKRQLVQEGLYQNALAGNLSTAERELLTRDRRAIHTLMHAVPDVNADGKVVGTRVTFLDITDRKEALDELQHLRNYLSNIIDSMPSVLIGVDRTVRVTQWNRQAEIETGIPFKEAIFEPLAEVYPMLAAQLRHIHRAIEESEVIKRPKLEHTEKGASRFEDVTIFPLVTDGGEGAVIRVDDVTERVRLEEMMIQSEKMLSVGGLAAGMAHEINNPLAGILQNTEVLENRLLGDLPANRKAAEAAGIALSDIGRYLDNRNLPTLLTNIRTSGRRAAAIVRNMLSFARKSDQTVSSHDLKALLEQAIELVQTDYDMKKHYDFKKIKIVWETGTPISPVPCDPNKLQQVFLNILKNGAEAMAEGTEGVFSPEFVLRVREEDPWATVEIEDNGPGMDEQTRHRVFEPFFTTKPVGKGTGLGLSVAYFIISEVHGGEMAVYSADGGGARFVIRLPKAGPESAMGTQEYPINGGHP